MKKPRRILVKVVPQSSQRKLEQQADGSYRAWLTKSAVNNQANEQLIELLAKEFGVAKSTVAIVKGQLGKIKIIEL
ncbi:MAG: DUF167 domain-containing protein [Candidatus Komeilibacteria bacterium]|nr:DUF167 domain-containing protein [Candidatus Komeilibacteria bacterium]